MQSYMSRGGSLRKKGLCLALLVFVLANTSITQVGAQQATVNVSPKSYTVPNIGSDFTVSITVQNVVDLEAWQFKLYYPNDILNGTSVTEGSFLKTEGISTFFVLQEFADTYNQTHGCIAAYSLRPNRDAPGVDGSGVLATITLRSKSKGGPSVLHLADVILVDSHANAIPCSTVDGEVEVNGEGKSISIISDLHLTIESSGDQSYFIYADPHRMTRAVATYDVASGSIVFGMCQNPQKQGFDTNSQWVSQNGLDRGRLLLFGETVLLFGGPSPQWCVSYLEGRRLTPVYSRAESMGDGLHFKFIENSTGTAKVDRLVSSIDFEHEDYFVIMTLIDQNNNRVFISYGFDWKGTWGAGIYLGAIGPNIGAYTSQYYIIRWNDSNADGLPQTSEMTQVASG
jgi:hypothetical protein